MGNKIIGLTVTIEEANLIFDSLDASAKIITDLKNRLYQDGARQLALMNKERQPESQQEQEQVNAMAEDMPKEGENTNEQ